MNWKTDRANRIGRVRLKAWNHIRKGDSKSTAFKKAWKEYKSGK